MNILCGLKQNDPKKSCTVHHIDEEGNQYCHNREIMEVVLTWKYTSYEENKKCTCSFGGKPLRKWSLGTTWRWDDSIKTELWETVTRMKTELNPETIQGL
jgi:hypothetical protein